MSISICVARPLSGGKGSRLSGKPKAFLAECLREARHYLAHNGPGWRFRGGGAVTMATLTPADQTVISAADPQLAGEVATILAWLAVGI